MDIPFTVSARPDTGLYNAKLGIWLFLASEVMLFGGLFSAYIFLRVGADYHWPIHELPVLPGFVNTMVLIASSVTIVMAWASLKLRRIFQFKLFMAITVACAGVFMVLKGFEYNAKFHHYSVELQDGTILTGHLPHGYEIAFGEATELSLTIQSENAAMDADPVKYVFPYLEGEAPAFKKADGSEIRLDQAGFKQLQKETVAAAREKVAKRKQELVEAGKSDEAAALNVVPPTTVKLTAVSPMKFSVKPSKTFGYTAESITFKDGTVVKGKLLDDRMTLEVDGVDARSVADKEKSLVWDKKYLGDDWKKVFIANRDHAQHEFKEKYGDGRDPLKSATLQKHSYFMHIHSTTPSDHAPEGAGHSASNAAPAAAEGAHSEEAHGHHPTVVLDKKDISFFSNFTPKLNTYYAIYFTLTGLHGLHVVAGALVLAWFWLCNGKLLKTNPEHLANRVEVGGLFWHFVDLVWIFLSLSSISCNAQGFLSNIQSPFTLMADNLEEIQKSIKKYIVIGTLLIVFTIITVLLSYWELPTHGMNIALGMIVATFKAGLVALIFMHLNHERSVIYKILAFTFVFAVVLFLLFHFTHSDPLVFKDFDATSSLTH